MDTDRELELLRKVDGLVVERERLQTALAGVVMHWREFGQMMCREQTDYGMDERIEHAARLVPYRVATKVRQGLPAAPDQQ